MPQLLHTIKSNLCKHAGVMLYHLIECIDGERKQLNIVPYEVALRIKLFC